MYTYDSLHDVLTDTSLDGEWVYTYDADGQLVHSVFTPNATNPDGLSAEDIRKATAAKLEIPANVPEMQF